MVDSVVRILEQPLSQIALSYLPGTRPDEDHWRKITYHARLGDSFYDGKYSDLGVIITNPLTIYETDSDEVKEAVLKFFTLATKMQSAQQVVEVRDTLGALCACPWLTCRQDAWKDFLSLTERIDLVRKVPSVPAAENGDHASHSNEVDSQGEDVKGLGEDLEGLDMQAKGQDGGEVGEGAGETSGDDKAQD